MKTLILIRHAKSSWSGDSLRDFDRPLNARGTRDAPRMAEWLAAQPDFPEYIVSSPANRAITTATIFAEALQISPDKIQREGNIYEAYIEDLRKIAETIDDTCERAALIGHNPGISEFASYLTGNHTLHFPTCTICIIQLDIDSWKEVTSNTGTVRTIISPKQIP